jgi:hypothetical protein
MIREAEVKDLISNGIPELEVELSHIPVRANAFKSIDCLTTYTKDLIRHGETARVELCFKTAYKLLHQGSSLVQLAHHQHFRFLGKPFARRLHDGSTTYKGKLPEKLRRGIQPTDFITTTINNKQ